MEAGGKISWLEDELSCPICQDIFKDPVAPPCQHNFCWACLTSYWKKKGNSECPVCREMYSIKDLKWNRTLANIVESFLKEFTKEQEVSQPDPVCSLHKELVKLYCQEDQEVMCVVCLHSKKHENHRCRPLEEATKESKEELKILMKSLQSKMVKFSAIRNEYELTLKHIKVRHREHSVWICHYLVWQLYHSRSETVTESGELGPDNHKGQPPIYRIHLPGPLSRKDRQHSQRSIPS
uniref:Tripartite motif-containing protein 35-like protein isoform 4 n=1 Tax=Chiloscyllium plagiosum TaxID=36176 RepID=A0A0H3U1H9_9CHON|nr:tripartite motif-containing protein 35-like protein isoform 4 [Chiloscyllium plagiosum]